MAAVNTGVYARNPFTEGVWAGLSRSAREGLNAEGGQVAEQLEDVRNALASVETNDRFVAMFAEMATVAAVARFTYGDAPLGRDQITDYVERSFAFFNSFRHP